MPGENRSYKLQLVGVKGPMFMGSSEPGKGSEVRAPTARGLGIAGREEGLASSKGQHCLLAALATPSLVPSFSHWRKMPSGPPRHPACFPTPWLTLFEATALREDP